MVFRGQTLGKYRIIEPLGSGGFGTVYLAEDTWIDKRVAHQSPASPEPGLRRAAARAAPARVAQSSEHRHGHHRGKTGQRVLHRDGVRAGRDARNDHRATKGALDLASALDYTCQIANAVEHAHKQGVIHRDLRPANVFVTEKGLLKVGDFGTSRFLEIAAHGTTVIGSPPYMAPEQFEGRAVFASDLYSLGVTMYQMLTGTLPYDTPAPSDLDRLRRGELVSPPRRRNPRFRRSSTTSSCTRSRADVATRYQRAEDLLNDLLARAANGQLAGAPARRRPPSRRPRADAAAVRVAGTIAERVASLAGAHPHARNRDAADSAGTAGNPCPRAAAAAPSVAKRSSSTQIAEISHVFQRHRQSVDERQDRRLGKTRRSTSPPTSFTTVRRVFEGARCYKTPNGSAFFRLDAHMRRLYDSARDLPHGIRARSARR